MAPLETADSLAFYLGISPSDPDKHVRLTDANQPGLAKALATMVSRRPSSFCVSVEPTWYRLCPPSN